MGKMKEREIDMKESKIEPININTKKYSNPKWEDYSLEIIDHCNKTHQSASDVIKEVKEKLSEDNW